MHAALFTNVDIHSPSHAKHSALQELRSANKVAYEASRRALEAIESSKVSLTLQNETLDRIEEKLEKLGITPHFRSFREAGGRRARSHPVELLGVDVKFNIFDTPGAQAGTTITPKQEVLVASPSRTTLMHIEPSPPPSDIYLFGSTPSPRSELTTPVTGSPVWRSNNNVSPVVSQPNPAVYLEVVATPGRILPNGHGSLLDAPYCNAMEYLQLLQPIDSETEMPKACDPLICLVQPELQCCTSAPPCSLPSLAPISPVTPVTQGNSLTPSSRKLSNGCSWRPTSLLRDLGLRDIDCRPISLPLAVDSYPRVLSINREPSETGSEKMEREMHKNIDIQFVQSFIDMRPSAEEGSPEFRPAHSGTSSYAGSPIVRVSEEREKEILAHAMAEVELEAAILNWMNFQMQIHSSDCNGSFFTNLKTDVQSGAKLIQLLHVLFPQLEVPPHHPKPQTGVQWRENMGTVFKMLRAVQAMRNHWTVNSIVLGKRHDILDFCWSFVEATLSHKLSKAISLCCTNTGVATIQQAELLCWVQEITQRHSVCISDFSGSWCDGLALAALIDGLKPDADHWQALKDLDNPVARINACMEVAEVSLKVPRLVPDSLILKGAERAILLYLSELIAAALLPHPSLALST